MLQPANTEGENIYAYKNPGEVRELLGVKPLKVFFAGNPVDQVQQRFFEGFIETLPQTGGEIVTNPSKANTIFFTGNMFEKQRGMWGFRKEFRRGVSGVFVGSIPQLDPDTDMTALTWTTLGNAFTQYGAVVVGGKDDSQ